MRHSGPDLEGGYARRGTTEDYTLHNLTVRVEAGDDIQAAVDNFGFIDQASVDWCLLPLLPTCLISLTTTSPAVQILEY